MTQTAAVEDLFLAALDRPPADRAAFAAAACAGDPDRLARVRELLAAHAESRGPLDAPPVAGLTTDLAPAADPVGTVVGKYKLVEVIGEGGMGTVYLARQAEPVRRLVALKVIKAGMDTAQVIARFEAERQALALMDHPNIAKVHDAGTTDQGRPYFVMELVKGIPITKYCDDHHLTPRQRLELFVPVCQAVQHAHQKGIIHRDLKPSNVLVAPYDGKPVVKVIDFGVAKAAGQPLTDKTLITGLGAVVGTLEYMSPEQAELNNLDVDTRSDIYSLGVLLYELLTGSTPLLKKRVRAAALLEVLRLVREEEAPRPSTRLSTTEELPGIAANRGVEPKKLSGLVRGELDWIVMRALEKDRGRRYETATGLAADVQRYLADEPVLACPPSAGYRLRKFARRNKRTFVAGTAAAVVVALGVVALAASNVLIRREQARTEAANERLTDNLKLAMQAMDEVYLRLVEDALPRDQRQRKEDEALLKQALAFYEQFAAQNSDRPGVRREMSRAYSRAGMIYGALGRHEPAKQAHLRGVEIAEQLVADDPGDPDHRRQLAYLLNDLAASRERAGENREAYRHAKRSFDIRTEMAAEFGAPRDRMGLATAHNMLGILMRRFGEPAAAAEHFRAYRDLVAGLIAEGGGAPSARYQLARAHLNLGTALASLKDPGQLDQFRQAIAVYAELVANADRYRALPRGDRVNPNTCRRDLALTHAWVSDLLWDRSDPDADGHLAHAIDLMTQVVADLPNVPQYRTELARVLRELGSRHLVAGRPAQAEELFGRAKEHMVRVVAEHGEHVWYRDRLALSHIRLGDMRNEAGDAAGVAEHYREAFALIERNVAQAPRDPRYLRCLVWQLSHCPDPAFRDVDRAVRVGRQLVEELTPEDGGSWTVLGAAYYRAGDWAAARAALERAERLNGDSEDCRVPLFLAMTHWRQGHPDEARRYYALAVPGLARTGPTRRFRDEAVALMNPGGGPKGPAADAPPKP